MTRTKMKKTISVISVKDPSKIFLFFRRAMELDPLCERLCRLAQRNKEITSGPTVTDNLEELRDNVRTLLEISRTLDEKLNGPTLESVIELCECYPFDDRNECRKELAQLFRKHSDPFKDDDQAIRQCIEQELREFRKRIIAHQAEEFIVLPEHFDFKYNHWHVLQWIVGRHYMREKDHNALKARGPYYFELAAISTAQEKGRMCLSVVDRMLAVFGQ